MSSQNKPLGTLITLNSRHLRHSRYKKGTLTLLFFLKAGDENSYVNGAPSEAGGKKTSAQRGHQRNLQTLLH